jgi:hypothetical protein
VYRRSHGTDRWHWCSDCEEYPRADYQAAGVKPSSGEFYPTCLTKQREGKCG